MPKVEKICVTCGESFSVWPNRAESAKTCSQPCRGKLIAKQYESARAKKVCVICSAEFSVPQCDDERRKCCSLACASAFFKKRVHLKGESSFNWKGGVTAHSDGYLYSSSANHPFASQGKYVFEHRLVMEGWMRQVVPNHHFLIDVGGVMYLRPDIEVHHINENKRDNKPRNLLACTASAHRAIHNGRPPMQGVVWPEVAGMVAYSPTRVTRSCEVCGREFIKKRCDVERGAGRFCSRICYNNRPRKVFDVVPL